MMTIDNEKVEKFLQESMRGCRDMDVRVLQDAEDALLEWDDNYQDRFDNTNVDVLTTVSYMRRLRKRLLSLCEGIDEMQNYENRNYLNPREGGSDE